MFSGGSKGNIGKKRVKNLRRNFFSLVKNLCKFPVITLYNPRVKSKHLLLLKCLKQKINAKFLTLLVQLMAHTISLIKLQFPKAGMIIVAENRDIQSVHKLSCDTICNSLISLEVSLGASMIQGYLDILYYIREQTTMK